MKVLGVWQATRTTTTPVNNPVMALSRLKWDIPSIWPEHKRIQSWTWRGFLSISYRVYLTVFSFDYTLTTDKWCEIRLSRPSLKLIYKQKRRVSALWQSFEFNNAVGETPTILTMARCFGVWMPFTSWEMRCCCVSWSMHSGLRWFSSWGKRELREEAILQESWLVILQIINRCVQLTQDFEMLFSYILYLEERISNVFIGSTENF